MQTRYQLQDVYIADIRGDNCESFEYNIFKTEVIESGALFVRTETGAYQKIAHGQLLGNKKVPINTVISEFDYTNQYDGSNFIYKPKKFFDVYPVKDPMVKSLELAMPDDEHIQVRERSK